MTNLTHLGLQRALAAYLRRRYANPPMTFTEVAMAGSYGSAGRMDVCAIWSKGGYTAQVVYGYEVKVSRADLLGDVNSGKYRKYLTQVDRLFFVFPADVGTVADVPPECGVILYHGDGPLAFEQVRKARPLTRTNDRTLAWRLLSRVYRELQDLRETARTPRT